MLRIVETESVIAKVLSISKSFVNGPAGAVCAIVPRVSGGRVESHVAVETVVELSAQSDATTSFDLLCPAGFPPLFRLSWRSLSKALRQVAIFDRPTLTFYSASQTTTASSTSTGLLQVLQCSCDNARKNSKNGHLYRVSAF